MSLPDLTASAEPTVRKAGDSPEEHEGGFPEKAVVVEGEDLEEDEEVPDMAIGRSTDHADADKMSSSSSEVAQFDDFDDQGT